MKEISAKFKGKPLPPPILCEGLICVEQSDGNLAILPTGVSDFFFVLEGVSAEALKLVNGKRTITQISQQIAKRHNSPIRHVESEIEKLFESLKKNEVLQ